MEVSRPPENVEQLSSLFGVKPLQTKKYEISLVHELRFIALAFESRQEHRQKGDWQS